MWGVFSREREGSRMRQGETVSKNMVYPEAGFCLFPEELPARAVLQKRGHLAANILRKSQERTLPLYPVSVPLCLT